MTNPVAIDRALEAAGVPRLRLPSLASLVDGKPVVGASEFEVLEKFTQRPVARLSEASRAQVAEAVQVARRAFEKGAPPPHERAKILRRTGELLDRERARLAELIVAETGFTKADANLEIDRSVDVAAFGRGGDTARRRDGSVRGLPRSAGSGRLHASRPGRPCLRDHALQLAAQHGVA